MMNDFYTHVNSFFPLSFYLQWVKKALLLTSSEEQTHLTEERGVKRDELLTF
jgi:hypothetical protein